MNVILLSRAIAMVKRSNASSGAGSDVYYASGWFQATLVIWYFGVCADLKVGHANGWSVLKFDDSEIAR
jgi:hypothetical protein